MSITFSALDHQEAFRDVFGLSLEEKGQYLDGLLAGAMGVSPDRFPDGPARSGAIRGNESRSRYEAAIQQRKEAGARSAQVRRERTGSAVPNGASNGVPNENPNGVPNGVPNENRTAFERDSERRSNGAPNGGPTASRTREEKRREVTPPLPPQGDEGGLAMGETELATVAAWAEAERAGFPAPGPWNERRRKALRLLAADHNFARDWINAVRSMAASEWAQGQRLPIDYLLRPENFQRWLAVPPPKKEPHVPFVAPPAPANGAANKRALLDALPRHLP